MGLQKLNFPLYHFSTRLREGKEYIFDRIRRKYVRLTPEEWVRQHVLCFLTEECRFPMGLISVERRVMLYGKQFRYDAMVCNRAMQPIMLVECKAPDVSLSQDVMNQVARYNLMHHVRFLFISNGLEHYCCEMDFAGGSWRFLPQIPRFDQLETGAS